MLLRLMTADVVLIKSNIEKCVHAIFVYKLYQAGPFVFANYRYCQLFSVLLIVIICNAAEPCIMSTPVTVTS